jgi:uncharacterized protein YeeX (DUF496 family)
MTYTLEELKEYISSNVAELDLVELLNLTSEDLVEAFHDTIEAKYDYLIKELELTKEEIDIGYD